jgi:hypothetical protein
VVRSFYLLPAKVSSIWRGESGLLPCLIANPVSNSNEDAPHAAIAHRESDMQW